MMSFAPLTVVSRPVDLSIPEGGFGPSHFDGTAQAWLEVQEFTLGEGLALPFRLRFNSLTVAPDFGTGGWTAPLFSSRALIRPSGVMHVLLPCGKELVLRPSRDGGVYSDGEWNGRRAGESIEVVREDGWKMTFNKAGFLVQLTTDEARTIEWKRTSGNHLVESVVERLQDGQVIQGLAVRRDSKTRRILAVETQAEPSNQRVFFFHYDSRGRLIRLARPDAGVDEIAWQPGPDGSPGMQLRGAKGERVKLAWGDKDRLLRWDGVWTYQPDTSAPGLPRVTRTGPYGETEVYHDTRKEDGLLLFRSADGNTTLKHHKVGGAAHGKLERVTRIFSGEAREVTTYEALYDDRGLLIEERDALGRKTTHEYELFGANAQSGVRRHRTTSALGAVTVKEYDRSGSLLAETDALGNTIRYEYDRRHRRLRTLGPDGAVVERISYTSQGRVASRTDALGATTRYTYDQRGNRIAIMDALGNVTREEFDDRGNRIRSTDPLGRTWIFSYDSAGRLIAQKDPEGVEVMRHTYDDYGRRLTTTDAGGGVTAVTYDLHGRVTSRRDALERLTRYEYDVKNGAHGCAACNASAQATTVISPSGARTVRRFDADQHLIEEAVFEPEAKAPLQVTSYEYDAAGQLLATSDGLGRQTRFQYDADGRRTRIIHADGTQRQYVYNPKGQLVEEIDEMGAKTERQYDVYGNLVVVTDPEGNAVKTLFTTETREGVLVSLAAARRPIAIQQASGRLARFGYDLLGRKVSVTLAAGTPDEALTTHEFDAVGNEILTKNPTGQATRHEYDVRNRRIKTTDALGRVWRFEYAATSGASGPAPCCGASPGGNAQAAVTIHPDGSRETRVTDAAGQLTSTTDAKGDTIQYRYSPDGRLAELIDGKGSVTKWRYDARGKLLAKTYPDGGTELFEHDAAGQMVRRVRPDGTAALHDYDARGRLLSVKWDGDRAATSEFGYDAAGRMTLARNPSASVKRAYTPTGRLVEETQVVTLEGAAGKEETSAIGYAYDADGRLSVITYPDGSKVQHYHNGRGELIEILDSLPMAAGKEANARYTYTRRSDGKITALTHPNGVTTTRDYDEVGRLAKIAHLDPSGKVLESEASTYDQRDRRLTRTRADGSTDLFRYDPAGQVTAAAYGQASDTQTQNPVNPPKNPVNPVEESDAAREKSFTPNQTFVYDEAGNRLEVTENGMTTKYQPNDANQYAKITHGTEVVEPEYDPQGNLLHDATRKYVWDADIHLMNVTTEGHREAQRKDMGSESKNTAKLAPHNAVDEAPSRTTTTRFVYDALHRRVGRVKDDGEVTVFVYEGWNVIAEKTVRRAVAGESEKVELGTRYVWGEDLSGTLQGAGGIGGLLRSVNSTENRELRTENIFHYDSNGNVILLTDTQGRESARYAYDAFGKTLTATGPAAQMNRYRFSTKPVEVESGLVYYGYRYYDPVTGRWPSRDPIGEMGGVNVYGMVGNGTISSFDQLGLFACTSAIAGLLQFLERYTDILDGCKAPPLRLVACINCCERTALVYAAIRGVTLMCGVTETAAGLLAATATAGAGTPAVVAGFIDIVVALDQLVSVMEWEDNCKDGCRGCN